MRTADCVPGHVAERFCRDRIFGIGGTVKEFIRNYKNDVYWYKAGPKRAGNGALMRIPPVIVPHLRDPSPALWADAALCAMITHNDSRIPYVVCFLRGHSVGAAAHGQPAFAHLVGGHFR